MENHLILKNMPLKVLILEDSLLDLELMTGHLSTTGYQLDVTHAEEETGFREALNGKKYDIILSDFKLPGFDAFGALEICLKICPEVPFICVSGSIGEELAIDLLKKGAVDYVLKDRPERLPFAVKHALEMASEKAALFKVTQELKESEYRFRQVAETAQEWIWEVDIKGLYTYASPVIESLLGYTPDEVVGKKYFYDFFIPEKREEFKQAAFEVYEKKGVFSDSENILLHKNGQMVIASTGGSPVFDDNGNFKGYRGVVEDITERKQAEEKLKLLNRAVESSSVSVIITDAEGHINYVNPYYTELTGYSLEEVLGKNPRTFQSRNQPKTFYEELWGTILSGKDWIGEFQNRKKSGELYWENAVISPILNSNGKVTNFVAIKKDITEWKRMLENLVAAKEKAEEGDKLKTAFINNISHEIRTPLNGILGFGEFIAEKELSEERRKIMLKMLQDSSARLMDTVSDYMDMAMISSNTLKAHKRDFFLEPGYQEIIEKTEQSCAASGIAFITETPPELAGLTVSSDPELLMKILNKLIDNALKFTHDGTITCGFELEAQHIAFFVRDTGIGISNDKLDLIFDMFSQEDSSMTRGYEGSGLGLSIAKGLVTLLGGEIHVASEKEKGSEFTFTIPYNNAKTKQLADKQSKIKTSKIEKPIVLVAEDDELNYLYLETVLDTSGYNCIHAFNGLEAVNYCRQNPDISVVLMDMKMPVMNGVEATRQIREFRPELPIIATTAYAQSGDKHRFLKAGCNGYIAKPIMKEKLLSVIAMHIE